MFTVRVACMPKRCENLVHGCWRVNTISHHPTEASIYSASIGYSELVGQQSSYFLDARNKGVFLKRNVWLWHCFLGTKFIHCSVRGSFSTPKCIKKVFPYYCSTGSLYLSKREIIVEPRNVFFLVPHLVWRFFFNASRKYIIGASLIWFCCNLKEFD